MAATMACSLQGALGGLGGLSRGVKKPVEPQCKLFSIRKNLSCCEVLYRHCKVSGFRSLESDSKRFKRLVKTAAVAGNGSPKSEELAVLWFKHDLRLDDHPGVVTASAYKKVLPVFVFDPHVCVG